MKKLIPTSLLLVFVLALTINPGFAQNDGTSLDFVPEKYKSLYMGDWGPEEAREQLDITTVSLERTMCFGECPVYTVTFTIDETATYEGTYFVEKEGLYTGKISAWSFGRLCYFIEKIGFKDLDRRYAAPVTDNPSAIITVTYKNNTTKSVTSYGGYAPITFWALTKVMDEIASQSEWAKSESKK